MAPGSIRRFFAEFPESFDIREILQATRAATSEDAAAHMRAFGQAGHMGEYAPTTLEEMAARYRQLESAAH
jgi:fructose-bisphosphate aldolase class II